MSKKSIDQRVVEMRFENQQFEHNAKETMSTLDKLKEKLKIGSDKDVDLGGLETSINGIKTGFSAMSEIAIGALRRIGEKAVDVGMQMTNALTIAPVMDGYGEYELKMGSIQTIMAGTGESLETVSKKLDELNHYADRTIYSFSDMTANIGKFTNAGVKLDTAVDAIQGVANLAAVSGANAQQASHAMYNFAQALSSGYVKLIDWKSIEVANMATMEFKQQLLDTAVALGTVVKEGDQYQTVTTNAKGKVSGLFDATRDFNDSLQHQWMTTEVLTATLAKYVDETGELGRKAFAAAQDVKTFSQLMDTVKEAIGSGWASSFEIVLGDFNEAKSLWTDISQIIGDMVSAQANARNDMLQEWKDFGGRDSLIEAMKNSWEALLSIAKPIKEAFSEIFPPMTGKTLADLTAKLRDFTAGLKLSDGAADKLKTVIKALLTPFKMVIETIKGGTTILTPFVSVLGKVGSAVLSVVAALAKLPQSFKNTIGNERYARLVDALSKSFSNLWTIVKGIAGGVANVFSNIFSALKIDTSSAKLKEFVTFITDKLIVALEKLSNVKIPDGILKFAGDSFEALVRRFKSISLDVKDFPTMMERAAESLNVLKQINAADTFDSATTKIKAFFGAIIDFVGNLHVVENLGKALKYLGSAFGEFISKLDAGRAVALAYGTSLSLFLVKIGSLFGSLSKMANSVSKLMKSAGNAMQAWANDKNANALLKFAGAVGILAASIIAISLVDSDKLKQARNTIILLSAIAAGFFFLLTKLGEVKEKDTDVKSLLEPISAGINSFLESAGKALKRASLLAFAAGVLILVLSMRKLLDAIKLISTFDVSVIKDNLGAYAIVIGSLIGIAKLGQSGGGVFKLAVGMGALALLADKMAGVAEKLSEANINLKGALATIGGIAVIVKALNSLMTASQFATGKMISFGVGLIAAAGGIAILIKAAKSLSELDGWDYAKTLGVVGGVMLLLGELMKASTFTGTAKAGTIVAMALAIAALSGSLAALSLIDAGPLLAAAVSLSGAMVALGFALKALMSIETDGLLDSLKKLIPALAMLAGVTIALAVLSGYDWDSLLAAATSLAEVMAALIIGVKILASTGDKMPMAALGTAGVLTVITLALSGIIKWLAETPAQNALASANALSELLLALVGSDGILTLLSKVQGDIKNALATLGVLTLVTAGLSVLIKWVAESDAASVLNAAKSLSLLLISLSASCLILGGVGLLGDKAFVGVGVLDALILSILGIIGGVAAIGEIVDQIGGEGKFVSMITRVGEAIGSFFGAIQGAFYSEAFSQMNEKLNLEPIENIFNFIKGIDDSVYDSLRKFAQALETIVTNGFITHLSEFGTAMGNFSDSISGLDPNIVTNSQKSVEAILCFAAAEIDYGKLSKSVFVNAKFNDGLVYFGAQFKMYANSMKHVKPEIVSQSQNAAKSIKSLFENIPSNNDLIKSVANGGNDLSNIGNELKKFGVDFKSYGTHMSKINVASINKTTNALKKLLTVLNENKDLKTNMLSNGLNAVKGFIKGISGSEKEVYSASQNIAKASVKAMKDELVIHSPSEKTEEVADYEIDGYLAPFGDRIPEVETAVSTMVAKGTEAANKEVEKGLEEYQKYFEDAMSEYASQYENMGASISDEIAKGITDNEGSFNKAVEEFTKNWSGSVEDIASNIEKESEKYGEEFSKNLTGSIEDIATNIEKESEKYGEEFTKDWLSSMDKLTADIEAEGDKSVKEIMNSFETEGSNLVSNLASGMSSNSGAIADSVSNIGRDTVDAWGPYSDEFYEKGFESVQNISNGITDSLPGIRSAVSTFGENMNASMAPHLSNLERSAEYTGNTFIEMLDRVDENNKKRLKGIMNNTTTELRSEMYMSKLRKAGNAAADGLIGGIKEKNSDASKAGKSLGQSILDGIKSKLNINSPSKETEKLGIYADEGLVNGLKRFSSRVAVASAGVGSTALDSMSTVISRIAERIDGNMDLDPVIRPILDLTEIENGASQLNSMLSTDRTFKMANDNSYMMARDNAMNVANNQNLSINDTGIISAIDKLHNDMASLSERINNMQVVMDSGALVGQLFAPMDSEFGTRIYRNLREREA